MSRARAWSAVVLRSILIALIAMTLAGASTVHTSDRLAVIAVVDVSGSIQRFADFGNKPDGRRIPPAQAVRRWLEEASANRQPDDLLGVVIFDGDSLALAAPTPAGRQTDADTDAGWRLEDLPLDLSMSEGTDIAGALRFAAALLPPDARKRLLLISDGDETAGDALQAARQLSSTRGANSSDEIPIDALPVSYNVHNETMIDFVDAPPQAGRESIITVRVGLYSTRPTSGVLRLVREGVELDINGSAPGRGLRIQLKRGNQVVPIQVRTPDETVHRFRAVFEPDDPSADTVAQNNSGEAFTVTPGKGHILIIDGVSDGDPDGAGRILFNTLTRAGLEVETVPPSATPADLLSLQEFDLVILQNVAAEEIPPGSQTILASYVRDFGGGLVMIGGNDSFGAGGWNGGEVEEILPVEMDLPESLVMPSAAIVIVLDSSGSMGWNVMGGTRTQQEIANEAAALAIMTLDKQDLVGVVEFNSATRIVTPLAPNIDPQTTANRVRAISPGGGTNLYPALAQAGEMLRNVKAQVKLVIVLSDGVSMGSPIYGQTLAEQLADEDVKVSTIAVGDGADTQTLESIALAGGGEYYRVVDPNLLPQIFIREVRVVRKPMIREATFEPVLTGSGSPITAGLRSPLPTLGGMVLTQPRPEATAVNAILAPTGEPVLAHWNIGLGRSAAWTSDASRWASDWISSPAYETLWTQLARTLSRAATSQQYDVNAEVRSGTLHLRLDAADDDGNPLDLLTVPGWVYRPDGSRVEVTLTQTGPGVYEAEVPAAQTGTYVSALTPRLGRQGLPAVVAGASSATSPEYSKLTSNIGLLRQIADETNGRILDWENPSSANLFDRAGLSPVRSLAPIWPTLALWSVLVMLLDVGTRRVAWDRILSRELAAQLNRHAKENVRLRGDHAVATLGRLRKAPGRAHLDKRKAGEVQPVSQHKGVGGGSSEPIDLAARKQDIREALRLQQGKQPASKIADVSDSKKSAPTADDSENTPTSSLLRAKHRARERFEEDRP